MLITGVFAKLNNPFFFFCIRVPFLAQAMLAAFYLRIWPCYAYMMAAIKRSYTRNITAKVAPLIPGMTLAAPMPAPFKNKLIILVTAPVIKNSGYP